MLAGIVLGLALPVAGAGNRGVLQGLHARKSQLPKGCPSCHQGMAMLVTGEEGSCLSCHGNNADREQMVRSGFLRQQGPNTLADIEAEMNKTYAHPTLQISGVHQARETLPEEIGNAARHAECVDCHNPHLVDEGKPLRGVMGKRTGNLSGEVTKEYELCYRCHSESANLPGNSTNKHAEFKTTNASFHPVEGEGKNSYVISLVEPFVAAKVNPNDISVISCSDCHGSDDPASPKGPHGSSNEGLLVLGYQTGDGLPESATAYALCYKCHDRDSILADESFPYHSLHIAGKITGQEGTSCYTCHDAHGSASYQHLIKFNEDVVSPTTGVATGTVSATGSGGSIATTVPGTSVLSTTLDGRLEYDARGYSARHGACYLNCHGVEHNPKEY